MKRLTAEWVKKAEDDYAGAVALNRRRSSPLPDLVCFHCQQSAEKYLKAFLHENGVGFGKTHDLEELLDLATPVDASLSSLMPHTDELNKYSVEFRYPGKTTTTADARDALAATRVVRAAFRPCLRIKPPPRRKKKP